MFCLSHVTKWSSWKWYEFILIYEWIKSHCAYSLWLLYLLVSWYVCRLVPSLGYRESCVWLNMWDTNHECASSSVLCWLNLLHTRSGVHTEPHLSFHFGSWCSSMIISIMGEFIQVPIAVYGVFFLLMSSPAVHVCTQCMYMCVYMCSHVEVRGQLVWISLLPLLYGSRESNLGHQSWQQSSLSIDPSHQSSR